MIGHKIKYYREKRRMTLQELSEGICAKSTLLRIEKGAHTPQLDTLFLLASRLEISIHDLINQIDSDSIKYINRIKQLCREFVNYEEYGELHGVICEFEKKNKVNLRIPEDFKKFLKWHEAIYIHKHLQNGTLAERMLHEIIPKQKKLITETDIGISNSLGVIYLEQKKYKNAMEQFTNCLKAIEHLPVIEDKLLFIRVGYSYALASYFLHNYTEVIDICYKIIYFADTHKIIYMGGRVNHLLGLTFEIENNLQEAEKHMRKATEIFLVESKRYLYLKALRALSEILFKAGKIIDALNMLVQVEDQLKNLDDTLDLPRLVKKMREKYVKEHNKIKM